MGLRTTVKVDKIRNLSDARYCAGMGVHYLGFSIDPVDPAYVDPDAFKSIKEWVVGPHIVGQSGDQDPAALRKALAEYEVDCLEVTHTALVDELAGLSIPLILKVDITRIASSGELEKILEEYQDRVIFFTLEKSDLSPFLSDWKNLAPLTSRFKIILDIPFDLDQLENWLEETNLYGIALKGGEEEVTGFKDYDDLADILEGLETD